MTDDSDVEQVERQLQSTWTLVQFNADVASLALDAVRYKKNYDKGVTSRLCLHYVNTVRVRTISDITSYLLSVDGCDLSAVDATGRCEIYFCQPYTYELKLRQKAVGSSVYMVESIFKELSQKASGVIVNEATNLDFPLYADTREGDTEASAGSGAPTSVQWTVEPAATEPTSPTPATTIPATAPPPTVPPSTTAPSTATAPTTTASTASVSTPAAVRIPIVRAPSVPTTTTKRTSDPELTRWTAKKAPATRAPTSAPTSLPTSIIPTTTGIEPLPNPTIPATTVPEEATPQTDDSTTVHPPTEDSVIATAAASVAATAAPVDELSSTEGLSTVAELMPSSTITVPETPSPPTAISITTPMAISTTPDSVTVALPVVVSVAEYPTTPPIPAAVPATAGLATTTTFLTPGSPTMVQTTTSAMTTPSTTPATSTTTMVKSPFSAADATTFQRVSSPVDISSTPNSQVTSSSVLVETTRLEQFHSGPHNTMHRGSTFAFAQRVPDSLFAALGFVICVAIVVVISKLRARRPRRAVIGLKRHHAHYSTLEIANR